MTMIGSLLLALSRFLPDEEREELRIYLGATKFCPGRRAGRRRARRHRAGLGICLARAA